ncbi:CYTOCHROME C OXIDASE SUBUNIT VIIC [Ceraceosorus bombacis]|uniref:Cytochrome c oxidase subunit 8, mitochondrial n=1 Tax=Ceraceosorus bombacis TaxID=401625 RepID=A0A0P1BT27_9BASI|nr:CYTOCHROME C OXIDASE SUBUNIT VIIC [Ceraceosorus bombacis]
MVSAILARRAVPLARSNLNMGAKRFAHVENTHETSLPFGQGPKNKVPIAIGLVTFLATGFSLPFVAARFQYKKANS